MHFEHYSNNMQDLQDEEVGGYRRSATNLRALIITQGQKVSGVQRNTITRKRTGNNSEQNVFHFKSGTQNGSVDNDGHEHCGRAKTSSPKWSTALVCDNFTRGLFLL